MFHLGDAQADASNWNAQPGQMYMTYYLANACQPGITRMEQTESQEKTTTVQVFPNPNNGSFEIKYTLQSVASVTIQLYNSMGNLVYKVDEQNQNVGDYQLTINQETLAAGVYFVRLLENGNVTATQKVIILN